VASLFRRRGFNIDSIAVGGTESEGVSRMTIVVDGSTAMVEQVEKQLYKLIDVLKVSDITNDRMIARELALIKVRCNNLNRFRNIMFIDALEAARSCDNQHRNLTQPEHWKTEINLSMCRHNNIERWFRLS